MKKSVSIFILTLILTLTAFGCSGVSEQPILPQDNHDDPAQLQAPVEEIPLEREVDSQRVLWGMWDITFDPADMKVTIEPARNLQAHFNITNMIVPPACDDCFAIGVNGFDLLNRILDVDVTLRNPTPIGGKDVRGILHTNDYGHLLTNPDAWTKYWDTPGGDTMNPFIAFAKSEPNRIFAGFSEHTENFLIYVPQPPAFFAITFAVDASYPGNCREPYAIEDFIQDGELYPIVGSSVELNVTVRDWQENANVVQIRAPEIADSEYVDFTYVADNLWTLQLVNFQGASAGDYEVMIRTTSEGVTGIYLYDFVTITISDTDNPIVTGIDPVSANVGENLNDVAITGDNFFASCLVQLTHDSYTLTTTDVEVLGITSLTCDFNIPTDADIGDYDVAVMNVDEKIGIGEDLFEVICPTPTFDYLEPDNQDLNSTEPLIITGTNFIGPTADVTIRKPLAWDIVGENVVVVSDTQINCDITLPMVQTLGLYDVHVTNNCGSVGIEIGGFEVVCPLPEVTSIDPDGAEQDETLIDVEITGENFIYPGVEVRLKMDGEPDIIATNIDVTDTTLLECDITIPPGAAPGTYDVEVLNGCGETAVGEEMFEVLAPPIGWVQTWGGVEADEGLDVAIDDDNNSYVTGYFRNTVDFDPGTGVVERTSVGSGDVFLCKFNPQSELEWALTWGSTSNDCGQGVAVDDNGVVLVTGYFQGTTDFDPSGGTENRNTNGVTDAFLSAFSDSGEFYGVSTWGGTSSDFGSGVITDGPDAYVTGGFSGTVDFDWSPGDVENRTSLGTTDIFILKAVGEGDFGWVQTWGDTGNDEGESVAVDSLGNVYVCGNAKGYSVDFDPDPAHDDYIDGGANSWAFLSKFDSTGDYLWAGRWGNNSDTNAADVAVDGSDNIYVAGHYTWYTTDLNPGTGVDDHACIGSADCYLSKFNSSGTYLWGHHWGDVEIDKVIGVAANSSGDVFVGGEYYGTADLDPDPSGEDIHGGFGFNSFFSKFDSTGDYIWGKSWGYMNTGHGKGVAANDAGDSWITGWFDGTDIDMDPDLEDEELHTSNGNEDITLTKFLPDGTWGS